MLPLSLQSHQHLPLYYLVALWCLQEKRWINRHDVAAAFHIDARRATALLLYLSQKNAANAIQCQRRQTWLNEGKRYTYSFFVTAVSLPSIAVISAAPPALRPTPQRAQVRQQKQAQDRALWQWLLRRPCPDTGEGV